MSFFKKNKKSLETKKPRVSEEHGAAIFIVLLLTISISLIIILGFTTPMIREFQNARNNLNTTQAYYASEAGNEDAYYRIKNNMNVSSFEQIAVNGATSSVSVITDAGSGITTISSSSSVNSRVRKVETKVSKSVYSVDLQQNAVFTGEGGLSLTGNAKVEGVSTEKGNVYSNGPIIGGTITGDAVSASRSVEDPGAQSTVCNSDVLVGKTSAQEDYAQSFVPTVTEKLSNVSLYIKMTGNASASVRIVEDNISPSNQPKTVATSSTDISNVGTAYAWINVSFASLPVLTAGTKYWIVVDADGNFNNKYFTWCKDSSNSYANGSPSYNNDWDDGSWTDTTGDMTFKTYFGLGLGKIQGVIVGRDAKANTISGSTIARDAYYQTITGGAVGGNFYPGSPDPVPLQSPIQDSEIDTWKADALEGGTMSGFTATTSPSTDLGPKRINGNLTVANEKTLTVYGTIHVTGNIIIDNGGVIKCADAFGVNGCIVIADGTITISNNADAKGAFGFPTSFILLVSTKVGDTAINLSNNANAAVLYAPYAEISLSNNVSVAAAMGYKVNVGNNAEITYQSGLNTLNFTPTTEVGGGDVWTINSWNETE
jgi:hypothetical protein